jgi:adenylate cyclase
MPNIDDVQSRPTRRLSLSLRAILAGVTLVTVLSTAAIVHLSWYYTATHNIDDTVQSLDRQISQHVTNELERLLLNAQATAEALRTIMFQRVVASTDKAKREFLFLAHLQSHNSLAWVSFGFPNGDFFGAHKKSDGGVQMVESKWNEEKRSAVLRIDDYKAADGDIWFQMRKTGTTTLKATELSWFKKAVAGNDNTMAKWTEIHDLPLSSDPGISAAVQLKLFEKPVGVISVSIALKQISKFLDSLEIGKTGSVYVVDQDGALVAAKSNNTLGTNAGILRLQLALNDLAARGQALDTLSGLSQWRATDITGRMYYIGVTPLRTNDWVVMTVIPGDDFLASIEDNNSRLIVVLVLLTAVIALLATIISRRTIDAPLGQILAQFRHIEAFSLDRVKQISSPIREIEFLSSALVQMTRGLSGFARYLPTELVQALIARGREDLPESREATVLYLDLQGFTQIGERSTPGELVGLLNEFFTVVNQFILAEGGAVIQFQGDAILATFNVPAEHPQHARAAVRAALAIHTALEQRTFTGNVRLRARIGINTGEVVAGTVGSSARANYTVHGDAVNLAARLENMNKAHNSLILVAASTVAQAGSGFLFEHIGDVEVRGKTKIITIYKLA